LASYNFPYADTTPDDASWPMPELSPQASSAKTAHKRSADCNEPLMSVIMCESSCRCVYVELQLAILPQPTPCMELLQPLPARRDAA
jgi:hypothetical protein